MVQNDPDNLASSVMFKNTKNAYADDMEYESQQEETPFEDLPDSLKDLISRANEVSEEVIQEAPSVSQKFRNMEQIATRTAIGRSFKRHAFICGNPGVGKTYGITRALKKTLADDPEQKLVIKNGSVGKGVTAIIGMLFQYQEGYVLLMDDSDSFLAEGGPDAINILKAALDPDDSHVTSGSPQARKIVAKNIQYDGESWVIEESAPAVFQINQQRLSEGILSIENGRGEEIASEKLTEESWAELQESLGVENINVTSNFIRKELNPLHEASFEDVDLTGGMGFEGDSEGPTGPLMIPSRFEFNSKMIFISNMYKENVPSAIADRCDVYELVLNKEEVMERIREVLPNVLEQAKVKTKFSAEEIEWGKANAFRWLATAVEADSHNFSIPLGNKKVPLKFDPGVQLTFRLFADLVGDWIKRADNYISEHPEASSDPTIVEGQLVIPFILHDLIPRITGSKRSEPAKKRKSR
jgi:hypothetical protein